ncbi:hypothetical protein HCU40_09050 [Pseudanabaena biceps]|nr:hypothetical protein [Pseudanabaena biceps]
MQDFWLLNGFFLALGLIYIIVALIFVFGGKSRNLRSRNESISKTIKPSRLNASRKITGYNLFTTGLLISFTAVLSLLFGQSVNLLVLAAINLAVTFIALRLQLFHEAESAPMPTIRTSENPEFIKNLPNDETRSEVIAEIRKESLISTDLDIANSELNPEDINITSEFTTESRSFSRKPSVEISPEIFAELTEISSDPAAAVDEAIRWWLRRRLIDVDNGGGGRKSLRSSESWRSQQQSWND